MSIKPPKSVVITLAAIAALAAFLCVAWFGAHLYWQSWVEENGKRDVTEVVEMLFAPGKQAVRVDIDSVMTNGWFGLGVYGLQVTALSPEMPLLDVQKIEMSPDGIPNGRSFRFLAEEIGPEGLLVGKVAFERYDIETDSRLKIEQLDAQLTGIHMATLSPVLRHFAGETALTTLLSWMSGKLGGSIKHEKDRGTVRLIADDLNMRKLHNMLPSISVDEFDLGVDYSPDEMVFSKASAIKMPNAEFAFRGGLRRAKEDDRLWDLAIELKTIPLLHAAASPILGCPKQEISWRTFAGQPSKQTYRVKGELLSPECTLEK